MVGAYEKVSGSTAVCPLGLLLLPRRSYFVPAMKKLIVLVLCWLAAIPALHAQTDTVLNRYRAFLFQREQPTDPRALMESLEPSGQWPDIDYHNRQRANWLLLDHLRRIHQLALAWAAPASPWHHQARVRSALQLALRHWLDHRYQNPNWWHNEIGVPREMRDILILMGDSLSAEDRAGTLAVLGQYRLAGTGANLVWSADLGFHYGALTQDTALMRICIDTIASEIKITRADGIQPDFSFHQHGARLQMYQYGAAFLHENVRLAWECRDTPWALDSARVSLLTRLVLDGWRWMARGINTVPGTMDRSASRMNALRSADLRGFLPFLAALQPRQEQAFSAMARWQDGVGTPLQGFHYFPYSDFAAYHTRHFSFLLKMMSSRTLPAESINSENLKGQLMNCGDGYLIRDGNEYFNLMPVWDWAALPGLTAFAGARQMLRRDFVGSVGNGQQGMSAMDYVLRSADSSRELRAHKVWIYHGNTVLCLIAAPEGEAFPQGAYTAMDQCRWRGTVSAGLRGGPRRLEPGLHTLNGLQWLYHADVAYIPLKTRPVRLVFGLASGSWRSINASLPDRTLSDKVFKPLLLHDGDSSAGYALAFVPSAAAAAQLAGDPPWTLLRNDSHCQAVCFAGETGMAAFFTPGHLALPGRGRLAVDRPCLVMWVGRQLYLSDPAHQGGSIRVKIGKTAGTWSLPVDGSTISVRLP